MTQPQSASAELSLEEKRRLLVEKLQKKAERGNTFPLSFAQQRMWVAHQVDPRGSAYNMPYALRLRGDLEVRVLARALTALVRRHESLRTVFPALDGMPVQLVRPAAPVVPLEVDLRALPPLARDSEADRLRREEGARPFELGAGPLLRVTVLRLADDDALVLFTLHHIVGDGWSQDVLVRDLSALYTAVAGGAEPALPPLPIQYADFAAWQREWLAGPVLQEQMRYWRCRLEGAPPLLELPTDRPRRATIGTEAGAVPLAFSPALTSALRALSRRQGTTLFITLLAGFQALLARWSGQDDVVVGTPVAGRSRMEVENLIGFFVNLLPLRVDLSGGVTFDALAARVRECVLEAHAHQDLPFEKLVDELRPERGPAATPLFQVLFTLRARARESLRLGSVDAAPAPVAAETARYDLELHLAERGERLAGTLVYRAELFDCRTIERMRDHLLRLLEEVTADPNTPLPALRLLGDAERAQVVDGWNATDAPYPSDATLHGLVEAQVIRTPGAVALRFEDEALTYAELNARANRLARHLVRLRVGPETRVGLCMERGVEMVVSLLAVLKAGGAYVPLDPGYPADRIAYMLVDSGVPVLLTQERLRSVLPATDARIISVDAAWEQIAAESTENVASAATPRTLAYVIYTSGSTGRPKGVMNEHGAVVNRLAWMQAEHGLTPGDVVLQKTPFSFDVSVWEFFWPLMNGATLVMARPDGHRDPSYLADVIEQHRVTTVHFVPSMLQPFVESADAERCISLKRVLCSGEALPPTLVDRFHARFPSSVGLHNLYGPTEAAVDVSYWPCARGASTDVVPIGRPVWNTRLYVLDGGLEPTPIGIPGELYIGGVQVARGYHGRPSLTAERFVPDPFGAPGARLYRTGDRARWRMDGALEYLGRLDAQLKIRGFRIELGEVESALSTHPGVRECAVLAREDVPGDRRLIAYVVGDADGDALRAHLRTHLPEHMVPAAIVPIDALPLTPNGKLDRRSLPAPEFRGQEERYVAPRTETERALAAVWAEVLRTERVGIHDSFFELGGDSILAIQVVSRARRAGVQITPRLMFEHHTIARLAPAARQPSADAPVADQGRVSGAIRLTPIQSSFLEQGHAAPSHYNQSILLSVDPSVTDAGLAAALPAVLEHHDALRLRFRRTDAGWEQHHADAVNITLERVDLSGLTAEERDQAQSDRAQWAQASLDLEHGPLGRALLFDRGEDGRVLLMVLHHTVVDGVSWRILREDLETACEQADAGKPIDLGPKTTSYRQWADALAAAASTGAVKAEAAHWLAQGAEDVAPLPVDGEGDRTVAGSRTLTVALDAEETRALLQEVPAAYRTQINDVLLCALADALGRWTGGSKVRLALEGHGREEEIGAGIDLTRTVGWFTSVYPLVLDVTGANGPGERLKRVKETLRAVPMRGIGYGVLRYLGDSDVRHALAAQPEPEIAFNYLGQFDQGVALAHRFRFAAGPRGRDHADANPRKYLLSVNGGIAGGCLQLGWTYGEGVHGRETVERLANAYLDALRLLIAHCRSVGAGGCTPSDFPLAEVTQSELDAIVAGRRIDDLYPLSPLQEGLLFHALSGGSSQAYQTQVAYHLEGSLDLALFQRAWAEVITRHAPLRTSFVWEGVRRPLQRVESAVQLPWIVEDWSGLSAEAQEAALERYLEDDRARGFRLDEAPLMRVAVFRAGADAQWIVWNQHHLLLDGWAASRVVGEVLRLYAAYATGRAGELPRARPYRDYIAWLGAQDPAASERYWRAALAGITAPTPLGVDRPSAGAEMRPERHVVEVGGALTKGLETAARRARVTLNTLLQGAWGVLLSRYGGDEDVVFGTTVAGRPAELEGVEEMIGLFINTLPVRMRIPGDARVRDWLAEVQRAQAEMREHEHTPLVQVQGWSEVPRGAPLFESHFIFENYPVERGADGAGAGAPLRATHGRAVEWTTYPLSLMAAPGPRLQLALSYDAERFDAATIGRMGTHLVRLLEQMADPADARVADLDPLDPAERRALLEAWGSVGDGHPPALIHPLVAARAARAPDAVALESAGRAVTFAELEADANRLAHHLRARGAGPETVVGVVAERTPETVAALLAVLKAGAAYLPLDPAYPADRLRWMVADSGTRLVVAHGAEGAAAWLDGVPVVDPEAEADAIRAQPDDPPAVAVHPENLAYVVYTSGSTGRPKGVAVTHGGVPNVAGWKRSRLGQHAGDRALQFASLSFDAAVEEVFGSLVLGGTLVLAPREALMPGEPLRRTLAEARITFATLPPAALAETDPAALPDLRVVVSAGEALPADVAARWAAAVQLHDAYGPTEATICATSGRVEGGAPSIGRPLDGVRVRVLDGRMRPVPMGAAGELYVGGAGVARGYLGRPALTAERFVPDPFATEPGARLYRTGDRARWRPDGTLAYGGRLDAQVKLRGFRIEPGEIEAALRRQDGVADAAVVVRGEAPGDRRLVAYVAGAADPDTLRSGLRQTLPEHMVPGSIVLLPALPRTPNGKLDRAALPAPEAAFPGTHVPPRTPAEELLARIWAGVLRVDPIGAEDGFFDLGGHSLLVMRMAARVREVFGVELPLGAAWEAPTLGEMAARIEALRRADAPPPPPIVPVDRAGPLPLSFAQERLWFLDRLQPHSAFYNVPLALRLEGPLDAGALERALGEVVRRHEALRTVFAPGEDGPVQVIHPFAGFTLPGEDLSHLAGTERAAAVRRRAGDEAARPFDLAAGPLVRAALLRLGDGAHVLLVTLHHVVSDAWSGGILFRELVALYAAFREGRPSPLAELPVQYADFAAWQRARLRGEALEGEMAYWRGRLADAPALLELPTDRPRPAVQSFRGPRHPVAFSPALLAGLHALGRAEGATLFMVLLAGFQVLLGKYAGTADVVVGTPVAGRARGEVEGLIGFFVNTLVLRTDLGGDPPFREVLRRVRETTLDAFAHQEVPFEKLVAELQPERSLGHAPLFQAAFTLQNAEPGEAQAPDGVRVTLAGGETETAKFDLTLALAESPAGLRGALSYAADLWVPDTIGRMAEHLRRLLEQAVAHPERRLSALELVGADERRRVLEAWNRTEAPYPREACIHALFHERARGAPDASALEWGDLRMTYGELDGRAEGLARRLAALGVGPEARVGVLLERGPSFVVAILAILRAGGAYVPLDPGYPPDRLRWMVDDSGARLVVTESPLPDALGGIDARIVRLDGPGEDPAPPPGPPFADRARAENLAYVFYTSGSTGRPKGVMVSHREVVQFARGLDILGMGPGERVGQASSTSFDAAVFETWGALLNGATVVGIEREALLSAPALAAALRDRKITLLYQTSALLGQQVREQADVYASVRQLVFGGEAAPMESVRRMLRGGRPGRVAHVYGPTETTVWCITDPVDAVADDAPTLPIGRPTPNARTYVLGPGLEPLPAGVPGEAFVGGDCVARGYLGRPALTAERFVPDPYAGRPGARMYRTGDRMRWLADGRLEFVGRVDEQVKIRGFRVEPGEVETALAACPGVRACRVVVREDRPGDRRLVAYAVGDAGADAMRAHLRGALPEHLVPAAFVALDRIPLTPNGKLDRRALPAPDLAPDLARYVAPATDLERRLAEIWAEVLELERVGRHDGFFELGGHSLRIVQVQGRIRERMGREVPVVDLFRFPTVASLAEHLGADPGTPAEPAPPPGSDRAAVRRRMAARRGRPGP